MTPSRPLPAIGLMVLAMAAFAVTDMFIKLATQTLPPAEVLLLICAGGAAAFSVILVVARQPLIAPALMSRGVMLRNGAEIAGTTCMIFALALTPISLVAAINQATPLIVTLGAALFLRERVGPRRWLAIFIGLAGVLLMIRPGGSGVTAGVLFSIGSAIFMALRDLATRLVPPAATTLQVATWGIASLVPVGAVLLALTGGGRVPDLTETGLLAAATLALLVAYYALTASVRLAEVSLVIPYRYSRILFALLVGLTVFGERPDMLTLLGAAIVVGSGLFVMLRVPRGRP